jgi:DNA-binding transcriptional LysR family regulator
VSEQLRTLERSLGKTLFDRLTGGWKLTDAGKIAYEQTSVMFRAGDRLVESFGQRKDKAPRTLRVGFSGAASRSTTSDILMPLLALEDCVPSIRTGDATELVRQLRASEADLVIVESDPPAALREGLKVELVDSISLVAIAHKGTKPSTDWNELSLVHYRPTSAYRWDVETFLETQHLKPHVVAEADDPLFLVEAATHDKVVTIVPESVARDSIRAGRVEQLAELAPPRAGVFALFPAAEAADLARRAVDAMIDHARASHAA